MNIECLIPKRNNGAYFPSALDSLLRQQQPFSRILVSENHSTDGSFEPTIALNGSARNLEVVVPPEPKLTYGENVAFLIDGISPSADYVLIAGSDDIWQVSFLGHMQGFAAANPGIGAVFCDRYVVATDFRRLRVSGSLSIPTRLSPDGLAAFRYHSRGICFNISGCIFRADIVKDALEIVRRTASSSDWILMLEAARVAGSAYLAKPLYHYRVHDSNTSNECNSYINCLRIYADWLRDRGCEEEMNLMRQVAEDRERWLVTGVSPRGPVVRNRIALLLQSFLVTTKLLPVFRGMLHK